LRYCAKYYILTSLRWPCYTWAQYLLAH